MRRIREARERKGLTREQLGERIGVSPSTIGKWETGDRTPSSDRLAMLSEELDVSTDYLLELDGSSKDSEGARRIIEILDTRSSGHLIRSDHKICPVLPNSYPDSPAD